MMEEIRINFMNRKILASGAIVFLFALFAGVSWKWLGYREQVNNPAKQAEQLPIGIGQNELISLEYTEDISFDGHPFPVFGVEVKLNESENNDISAIDFWLSYDRSKTEYLATDVANDFPYSYGMNNFNGALCDETKDVCFYVDDDDQGGLRISVFNIEGNELPQMNGEMFTLIFDKKTDEEFAIGFSQDGNQILSGNNQVIDLTNLGEDIVVGGGCTVDEDCQGLGEVCKDGICVNNQNAVIWETPYAKLSSTDFYIQIGDTKFYGKDAVNIQSDPGINREYTTLEAIWFENGVEMRIFMYFRKIENNMWEMYDIRTYDGNEDGDWIFYRESLGNTVSSLIAHQYYRDEIIFVPTNNNIDAKVYCKDCSITAFITPPQYPFPECSQIENRESCNEAGCSWILPEQVYGEYCVNNDNYVGFKIKLSGVGSAAEDGFNRNDIYEGGLNIKVKTKISKNGEEYLNRLVNFSYNPEGYFESENLYQALSGRLNDLNGVDLELIGPQHGVVRIGQTNYESHSFAYVFDLTNNNDFVLRPSDLPYAQTSAGYQLGQQDGRTKFDEDLRVVRDIILVDHGDNNRNGLDDSWEIGDVNYNQKVNTQDYSLVRDALGNIIL